MESRSAYQSMDWRWKASGKDTWIEKGVVKNLTYSRYWAEKKGVKAVPSPDGFIMEGGTKSLDELIKGTKKGILVTRFGISVTLILKRYY